MNGQNWSAGLVGDGGVMWWRRTFYGRSEHIEAARRFAAMLLAGTGRVDDVELIVSELATNTVTHTRSGEYGGLFTVEVGLGQLARIAVTDQGGEQRPVIRYPDPFEAEHGRGLLAVSELSVGFGVYGSPDNGHTVWADLTPQAVETRPDRGRISTP